MAVVRAVKKINVFLVDARFLTFFMYRTIAHNQMLYTENYKRTRCLWEERRLVIFILGRRTSEAGRLYNTRMGRFLLCSCCLVRRCTSLNGNCTEESTHADQSVCEKRKFKAVPLNMTSGRLFLSSAEFIYATWHINLPRLTTSSCVFTVLVYTVPWLLNHLLISL